MIWFNGRENHFIFQFGDDGAPETSSLTMSVATLTCWNFGQQLHSRDFQYALHGLSGGEKDAILTGIWHQHTQEMLLLEESNFTVNEEVCSFGFQPFADQSWQSWAANEVSQSATYLHHMPMFQSFHYPSEMAELVHVGMLLLQKEGQNMLRWCKTFKQSLQSHVNCLKKPNMKKF